MEPKRKQKILAHPQSEGNLALIDERLTVLQKPKVKTLVPVVRGTRDVTEDNTQIDDISPAKGIIGAVGVSALLWCLIFFVIYWVR
jgi:hypothetical protein